MTKLIMMAAFPLSIVGAVISAYAMGASEDSDFRQFGLWPGMLVGAVTAVTFAGFVVFVNWKIVSMPQDLFSGPLRGDQKSIHRQALICSLALAGAGLGFFISAIWFHSSTIGLGISELIPGLVVGPIIFALWASLERRS